MLNKLNVYLIKSENLVDVCAAFNFILRL